MTSSRPAATRAFAPVLTLTLLLGGPALAQETIGLGNGATLLVDEYLIETAASGEKTLLVRGKPGFDPEPFGQVPADNYARTVEPVCRRLVAGNWDKIEAEGIGFVRFRYDFDPTVKPDDLPQNMSISRFHEMRFAILPDRTCDPMPFGVANLSPELPSGVAATLKYAEPGRRPRDLSLVYEVEGGISAVPIERLENAAIELCIVHGDAVLADRARYYQQLETTTVTISFVEQDKPGWELERRVTFEADGDRCVSGMSEILVEAIRSQIEEANAQ